MRFPSQAFIAVELVNQRTELGSELGQGPHTQAHKPMRKFADACIDGWFDKETPQLDAKILHGSFSKDALEKLALMDGHEKPARMDARA